MPEVLFGGLLGLVTATLAAMWLRVDAEGLAAGLYGYNGILVGLALATFLAPSPLLWGYVVLGAAVSVVAMLGTVNVTKTWRVSALTFPFVLTTWLLLLAAFAFAGLGSAGAALCRRTRAAGPGCVQPARPGGIHRGYLQQHLAGLPQGQLHLGAAVPGRAGGQFARRGAASRWPVRCWR